MAIIENHAEFVSLKFKDMLVTDLLDLSCMFLVEFVQLIEQLAALQLLAHQPDFTDPLKNIPIRQVLFQSQIQLPLLSLFPI